MYFDRMKILIVVKKEYIMLNSYSSNHTIHGLSYRDAFSTKIPIYLC